jgi:hypothetical protein
MVRLGVDAKVNQFFDLAMTELAQHVLLPGATGTGKTTTLRRLADGTLASGWGVVVMDCKGSPALHAVAMSLARRYDLKFSAVQPDDPKSKGYNPCSGDAPTVANKLVGAFTYGANAEIYKLSALEVIPVIVRALIATGEPVTLDALYETLSRGGLAQLGRRIDDEALRNRVVSLESRDGLGANSFDGLRKRFGALIEGKFGELFHKTPVVDWDKALATPSVTYLGLSALASSEDVELMGRVYLQDIKQACFRRLQLIAEGVDITPVLLIIDEFAALREPAQVVDLLLQAREALMPVVISTQYLPQLPEVRQPLLQAGLLIVHRVASVDAEALAAEFGTRTVPEPTSQVDYETGETLKGSIRMVDKYHVHPNEFRDLAVGVVAIRARQTNRRKIVKVLREEAA